MTDEDKIARALADYEAAFAALQKALTEEAPKPADDGWIAWAGGEMPVPPSTLVDVRLSNRRLYKATQAGWFNWSGLQTPPNVIAYRVVKGDDDAQ